MKENNCEVLMKEKYCEVVCDYDKCVREPPASAVG